MGIPVIVAGEAWIKNKGLTTDPATASEYFAALDRLPFAGRLDKEARDRALKYAYHFFFRRMIPVKGIEVLQGWPPSAPISSRSRNSPHRATQAWKQFVMASFREAVCPSGQELSDEDI